MNVQQRTFLEFIITIGLFAWFVCSFVLLIDYTNISATQETLAEDYGNCYWAFTCTEDPQYCTYEAEMTRTEIEYFQWECKIARNYEKHQKLLTEVE